MTNSISVIAGSQRQEEDMFADLEPLSVFDVKKDLLASQLTALMIHCGKSRSEIAEELGWQKSRVTKILSGHNNLTIKTISEFSAHLGYDFDVIFHSYHQPRPKQPWELQKTPTSDLANVVLNTLVVPIESQSAGEVLFDLLSGNGKKNYFSFVTATQALPPATPTKSIPIIPIGSGVSENLRRG